MQDYSELLDISIHEGMWLNIMTVERWIELFTKCCDIILEEDRKSISIRLTNDVEMIDLNTRYRSQPHSTNVLSFSQDYSETLGDIVLAFETIQKEASEQNKTFINHVTHLFMHGLLHLKGYDHETPEESKVMEDLEIKALATLGIGNPYE